MKAPPLLHRRLLTASAIALMVSSALLSFFLVQENDRHIAELKRNEEKMDQAIRALWDGAASEERNADAAVIISLLAKDATPEAEELKRHYLARAGAAQPGAALTDVLKEAEEGRKRAVDAVNDVYLSRLDVENEIMLREAANKRTAACAFLLQLLGLVLVILTREMHAL